MWNSPVQPLLINGQPTPYMRSIVDQVFSRFDINMDGALSLEEFNAIERAAGENVSPPEQIAFILQHLGIPLLPNRCLAKEGYVSLCAINLYYYPAKTKRSLINLGIYVPEASFPPAPPPQHLQVFEANLRQAAHLRSVQNYQEQAQMLQFTHNLTMGVIRNFPGGGARLCSYCSSHIDCFGQCPRCSYRS